MKKLSDRLIFPGSLSQWVELDSKAGSSYSKACVSFPSYNTLLPQLSPLHRWWVLFFCGWAHHNKHSVSVCKLSRPSTPPIPDLGKTPDWTQPSPLPECSATKPCPFSSDAPVSSHLFQDSSSDSLKLLISYSIWSRWTSERADRIERTWGYMPGDFFGLFFFSIILKLKILQIAFHL